MTNENEVNLEAIIKHEETGKYVVIGVPEKYFNPAKNSKKIVLISRKNMSHGSIVDEYLEYIPGGYKMILKTGNHINAIRAMNLNFLGGGILTMDPENKHIRTFGKSQAYGKPDRDLVEKILKTAYPDYTLDIQVTDEVRD